MNDADRALVELAARQRGVFTRAQAHALGINTSDVGYRIRQGRLVPCGPHTLTFAGVDLDWRAQLMAGLLDLGQEALVSGSAAAALHELDGFAEGPLEFLVPRSTRNRITNGVVRSTGDIGPLDRCTVDGLAVTSPTFTIVQLLGRVSAEQLGNALDSATRRRLTAPVVVRRRVEQLGRAGRRGLRVLDEVMASAGVESWLERQFLKLMLGSGLPRPTIQRVHRRDGTHVARVDFDFEPFPVVVEVGGRRGYMAAADRQRQEHRRNELQLLGKTIYFFTTEDVKVRPAYVLDTVRAALGLAA